MLKSEAVSYRLSIGEVGNLASEARDRDQEVAPTAKPGIATRRSLLQRSPGSRPGGRSYSEGSRPGGRSYSKTRKSLLQEARDREVLREKSKLQEN